MGKIIILCLINVFLATSSFSQTYGWIDISSNLPDSVDLSDLYFINPDTGWISSGNVNKIYKTTDGGVTFTESSWNPTLPTFAIHMVNPTEGYCGGTSGLVYKSTDGGINWSYHGTITQTLTDINFPPSGGIGYACGLDGKIYSITSSNVLAMTSGINGDLNSIVFPVDHTEGWVCGLGSVIRHFTGGNWVGDQINITGHWSGIFFLDNQIGWVVGNKIKHTTDGITWAEQTNPDPYPGGRAMTDVVFLNANEGWIVGNQGLILHTLNGGSTWNIEADGLSTSLLSGIQFISPTTGYIVGNNNTLLKYTNLNTVRDIKSSIEFEVFPNPTSKLVHIQCSEFKIKDGAAEILSIDGKTMLKQSVESGNETIEFDVSELAKGTYLCTIVIEDKTSTKKLIIE